MTNTMPTRNNNSNRGRDWGNTPVLFSLKNVQPLLVTAPPREVTPVEAEPSNKIPASGPSLAPPMGLHQEEPRVKPAASKSRTGNIQKYAVTGFVVLLILFVLRISIPTKPTSENEAIAKTKEPALSLPVSSGAPMPGVNSAVPASSNQELLTTSPAGTAASASGSSSETPRVAQLPTTQPGSLAPSGTGIQKPLTIDSSDLAIPAAKAASSPSAPASGLPALLEETKPTDAPKSNWGSNPIPNMSAPIPAAEPVPSGPPSSDASLFLGANRPSPSNIDIVPSLSPDAPMDAIIAAYDRAKQLNNSAASATAPRTPYTPVSSQSAAGSYQPISTGLEHLDTISMGLAPNASSTPQAYAAGYVPTNKPLGTTQPAPSWDNLNSYSSNYGSNTASTPMLGQSYPAPRQEYRPLTIPENYVPGASSPTDPNAAINRYQPIRQPMGTPSASEGVPTRSAPYVPIGAGSPMPSTGVAPTSYGYPPIK